MGEAERVRSISAARHAYADAADLEERRWAPRPLNYASRLSPG